jgi:hypothetical protein
MAEPGESRYDPRCLNFDHHFDSEDLYDYDGGKSMRESLHEMIAEMKQMLAGKMN